MKKYIFLFTIFSFAYIFLNYASASSFTQTIILKPGWNIISTPKILNFQPLILDEMQTYLIPHYQQKSIPYVADEIINFY